MIKLLVVITLTLSLFAFQLESAQAKGAGGAKSNLSNSSAVKVKGYTHKNGAYVQPYRRTGPNKTKADNWSAKGNVNPDTGRLGSKK